MSAIETAVFGEPIQSILKTILPKTEEEFPLIESIVKEDQSLSILLLCQARPGVGKFFHDMIYRWLLPGEELNIGLSFSVNCKIPELGEEIYFLSKMVIHFPFDQDMALIKKTLDIMKNEIRLGIASPFHASRILHQKTSPIQERVASLVHRYPDLFDYDIFDLMQQFVGSGKEAEHLAKVVAILYLFQKNLEKQIEETPYTRHLSFKISRVRLDLPLGVKNALSVFVGMNFLKENEIFHEEHLLRALSHHVPGAKIVENSLFIHRDKENRSQILYVEVEKEGDFSGEEMTRLRKFLPAELKNSPLQLVRPIFMPRNEEEVMRGILTLSHQLKYVRDLPQMTISFDEQTDQEISFTVILLRLVFPNTPTISDLFAHSKTFLQFVPDRVKQVGWLRKKYPKEANVFRVKLKATGFLREDHSVDLYKARLHVVTELERILGKVRDYNGGVISKQIEMLATLKSLLGSVAYEYEFLLENFFHSITPVEMRTVIDPHLLKTLFLLFLHPESQVFFQEEEISYFALKTKHPSQASQILSTLDPSDLTLTHFQLFEITYLGIISPHLLAIN